MIPARLRSSRLPGKPLRLIAGRPLIEWVWRRASSMGVFDQLVIATQDYEIAQAVEGFGGRIALTGNHSSGTERVAEVMRWPEFSGFQCIVNVQGDEPFLPMQAASAAIAQVESGWDVGTAAVPITDVAEWRDPSTVKVVRDDRGGALYFSRAPIPHAQAESFDIRASDDSPWLRHVGIYAFTRSGLEKAITLPRGQLEALEALEQLRWLAAGIRIGVAVVHGGSRGIDTEEDLVRAEGILTGREEFP